MQTNSSLPPPGRWIFPCFTRKKTEGVPLFNANKHPDKSKFEIAGGETPPLQQNNIAHCRGGVLPPDKFD